MHGFGDSSTVRKDAVDVLEMLLDEYIREMSEECVKHAGMAGQRVGLADLLFALHKDPRKLKRATELLNHFGEMKHQNSADF